MCFPLFLEKGPSIVLMASMWQPVGRSFVLEIFAMIFGHQASQAEFVS